MLFPGYFFDIMQEVNRCDDEFGYKIYHEKRNKFIEKQNGGIQDSNFTMYAIMAPYLMLEDEQLEYGMQ